MEWSRARVCLEGEECSEYRVEDDGEEAEVDE